MFLEFNTKNVVITRPHYGYHGDLYYVDKLVDRAAAIRAIYIEALHHENILLHRSVYSPWRTYAARHFLPLAWLSFPSSSQTLKPYQASFSSLWLGKAPCADRWNGRSVETGCLFEILRPEGR